MIINLLCLALGMALGYVVVLVQQSYMYDRKARERATRRAVLGLPDRDAPQRGARGTATVHVAEYREKEPDAGMDAGPDSA